MIRLIILQVGKARLALLVLLLFVVNVLDLAGLSLFIPIIDSFQSGNTASSQMVGMITGALLAIGVSTALPILLLLLCGVFFVKSALALYLRYLSATAAAQIQMGLRDQLFKRLLDASVGYVNAHRTGVLMSTLNDHVIRTGHSFFVLTQLIVQWATALVYASFALAISWKLALIALLLGTVVFPIVRWIGRRTHFYATRNADAIEDAQHFAMETLQAKKVVNAMNWQGALGERYAGANGAVANSWLWTAFFSNSPGIVMQPFSVAILCLLIWLSYSYQMSMGLLAAFVLAFIRLLPTVQSAVTLGTDFKSTLPAIARVKEMLENASQAYEPSGKDAVTGFKSGVSLREIDFKYGDSVPLLEGVNIDIPRGQMIALVGPSGSGKTTLADLLLGLQQPSAGKVMVDGRDLATLDITQFRALCAYVSQESILLHDTIRNNLLIGIERPVDDAELKAVCEQVGAWAFIDERPDKLDAMVGDRGLQLSGGQRQRLALARCLLRRPRLLILDEATSALDQGSEEIIHNLLTELKHSGTVTMVVIAHRYSTIRNADQIYELREGKATPLGRWEAARVHLEADARLLDLA